MYKGIEWLKKEVWKQDIVMDKGYIYTDDLMSIINEVDEPEVLSQKKNINIVLDDLREYIKEQQSLSHNTGLAHTSAGNDTHYRQYDYVLECINEYEPSDELQNLLVPKQEITFDQVHDKLREESILSEKSFDYYWNCINDNVEIDEPGNLIVPKQEKLETKIHELIESYKQEEDAYSNPENGWISGFIEDLKNLVEKEQKYYVSERDEEYGGFWFLSKTNNGGISIGVNRDWSEVDWDRLKLTEQEIKDYDERYWAFAEPVEGDK